MASTNKKTEGESPTNHDETWCLAFMLEVGILMVLMTINETLVRFLYIPNGDFQEVIIGAIFGHQRHPPYHGFHRFHVMKGEPCELGDKSRKVCLGS